MRTVYLAMAATALIVCSVGASAAPQKKSKVSGAESGLIGVKLYDTGISLINKFGSPDDIQSISAGGSTTTGPATGGTGSTSGGPMIGGAAGTSVGGGPGMPSGMGKGPGVAGPDSMSDTDFLPFDSLFQATVPMAPKGGATGPGMPPGKSGSMSGPIGGPMGGPMGGGTPAGLGAGGMAPGTSTSSGRTIYTRWLYKRDGCKYGFILDKQNRVVQIEAIGLTSRKVRTNRGVTFGAKFGDIIKKYNQPDAYEISNNTITMRYLVKNKVAFRLNRLGVDKPHVVTGIVVAAGKS